MERLALGLLLIALGIALVVLAWRVRAASAQRKGRRAGFLDDCEGLFRSSLKAVVKTGFPRISGEYRGHTFDVQVTPDMLAFRKLPTLWLLVTLPEAMPVRGTFDLMMRPTGVEPFSKHAGLPDEIAAPGGFPEGCVIRSDSWKDLPDEATLRQHLGMLAANEQFKELVVSAKGLRVVWLAEEADRGQYLLFRDAEMGQTRLDPAVLRRLMDGLLDIRDDLVDDGIAARSRIA
jgi:hypothetical protein